jgi:hypothetical protein
MDRRIAIAKAQSLLIDAIVNAPELTPMEWMRVFGVLTDHVVAHGLVEEWNGGDE